MKNFFFGILASLVLLFGCAVSTEVNAGAKGEIGGLEKSLPSSQAASETAVNATAKAEAKKAEELKRIQANKNATKRAPVNASANVSITSGNWCPAGSTVDVSQQGSASNTVIQGFVTYQGKTMCKGISKTTVQYVGEITTEYYFNEKYRTKSDGREIYIVTNAAGRVTTVHLVNDVVIN